MSGKSLISSEKTLLTKAMVRDFVKLASSSFIPDQLIYSLPSSTPLISRSALYEELLIKTSSTIKKFAFDSRRTDQEHDRNPRENLQYYHRSEDFVPPDTSDKIAIFSKLLGILTELKEVYGSSPDWHSSYSRVLYDTISESLKIKQGGVDIYPPQLSYLEQLFYTRYRLTLDDLVSQSPKTLKTAILSKDEALVRRGNIPKEGLTITGDGTTQQSFINAVFGSNNLRKGDEKAVERTITITIRDQVIE